MTLASSWRRVQGPFREFGAVAGTLYCADRVLQALSPRLAVFVYELMLQPVPTKPLLPSGLARNLTFELIGPDHPDLARMPAREDIKKQRFAQGAWCLATYKQGELLGYAWFCGPQYEEDEVRCTYAIPDGSTAVFDFDLYVMPEHRMGLAFSAIWHGTFLAMKERSIEATYSRMTRFNMASRRAHARLGALCVGRAMFVRLGRVELMISTLAPFAAVTWAPSQRVRLQLPATTA